jgi:hypothetical protein
VVFPVEVKVNIAGGVAEALAALGEARSAVSKLQIWFAETRNAVEHGDLALLNSGVIIRFRSGEKDDLTVKLRPCTQEQLVESWSAPSKTASLEYRIEGDWSGQRRSLAASAVSKRPQGSLLDAVKTDIDAAAAVSADQREFLATCAPGVRIDGLRALGPISATKFSDLSLGDLDVNMERWTVADLDFLEVSIRVEPKDGESADEFELRVERKQKKLEKKVREHGVVISDRHENKTKIVLTALADAFQH